jgi:prepilin-type N-terminal cleavage/methylation domain-containing protein
VHRRGFTLLELTLVLSILGILIALAVPTYNGLVHRARATEARTLMDTIAHAELAYFRDNGKYLPCFSPMPERGASTFADQLCWKALGIQVDGFVRYGYEVTVAGTSFTVVAQGDLNGDGKRSKLALDGATFKLEVEGELE